MDIDTMEQVSRLAERQRDPLKQWKSSPIDAVAVKHWKAYSAARDQMLSRTSTPIAPWFCVHADDKKAARLNIMRHVLDIAAPAEISADLDPADPAVIFAFEEAAIDDGRLAK